MAKKAKKPAKKSAAGSRANFTTDLFSLSFYSGAGWMRWNRSRIGSRK